jgi:D-alanyl-D-alanine endopeptidase (penicillin-binding protein 7)
MLSKILFLFFYLSFSIANAQQHSIIVYNVDQDAIIDESNADIIRPIASITKLMTAIVALENYDLDQIIKVTKKQTVQVSELITRLLVRSDNFAGEMLAKNYPGGRSAFITAMNDRAKQFNLNNTRFIDPSGLGIFNVSTAFEIAKLVAKSYSYDFIRQVANKPEIITTIKTKYGDKQVPVYSNTSRQLLVEFNNIIITKTGFTSGAGRCIAMMVEKNAQNTVIVILGKHTKQQRDNLARQLIAGI